MVSVDKKPILRLPSLFSSISVSDIDEERVIEEALTTPFEKVMAILRTVKKYLVDNKAGSSLVKDLDWVVQRIVSHSLYTFELNEAAMDLQRLSQESNEVKTFLEFLKNYSETKTTEKRPSLLKSLMTKSKLLEMQDKRSSMKYGVPSSKDIRYSLKDVNLAKTKTLNASSFQRATMNFDGNNKFRFQMDEDMTPVAGKWKRLRLENLELSNKNSILINEEEYQTIENEVELPESNLEFPRFKDSASDFSPFTPKGKFSGNTGNTITDNSECAHLISGNYIINEENYTGEYLSEKDTGGGIISVDELTSLKPVYDVENVLDIDFDIFEFVENVGRADALPKAAKTLLESFNLSELINRDNLDNFLTKVRDSYHHDVPYHNELHGVDVCQTISVYISHTNLIEILILNDYDILAIMLSSLTHDLAHPGTNNNYQINSYSDIAVNFNDKSVLENYHASETFKIMKQQGCNILEKLTNSDFKHVRKRIIENILATDMIYHAKIQSLVKNKLQVNGVKDGQNSHLVINNQSTTLFDDQQEILNFLIHTADLSHNSKDFKISHKWSYLLSEEFWRQGDLEKEKNLPVSFLCDRNTADVPKSQIGFIKGIIIPTFDILVDFLPSLVYYKENVLINIEEWGKISAKENEEKEKK
jgi:hypothetical protein